MTRLSSAKFQKDSTIVAIATAIGTGGIAVVRLSGKDAFSIADQLFLSSSGITPSLFPHAKMEFGTFSCKTFKDKCLCVGFKAPKSFTGEDVVEFHVHGGEYLARGVLLECISLGAKMAGKGEFSKRAFLNGHADLSELEGMIDMIEAESDAEIRAGFALLSGKFKSSLEQIESELIDVASLLEVGIDYPDEDVYLVDRGAIQDKVVSSMTEINRLIETSEFGRKTKSGISVLIYGKPNVGKSSILNALLRKDRAIVTDIPGTTRDTLEESMVIDGFKFRFIDTAGVHETKDTVERLGIKKAKEFLNSADIILFVVDASNQKTKEDEAICAELKNKSYVLVQNKADKKMYNHSALADNVGSVFVSGKTGEGIDTLIKKIKEITKINKIDSSGIMITNERHIEALKQSKQNLQDLINELSQNRTYDILALKLKTALDSLGEITGKTASEEIINNIFSKFCVGK